MAIQPPSAEELFDVVDQDDRVLRQAPRSVVHANHWLHRASHIFVFNTRGELLIHRRAATKDECPRMLTSSASGHLAAGEGYETAAVRELEEELGLRSPIEFLTVIPPTGPRLRTSTAVCSAPSPMTHRDSIPAKSNRANSCRSLRFSVSCRMIRSSLLRAF